MDMYRHVVYDKAEQDSLDEHGDEWGKYLLATGTHYLHMSHVT